MAAKLVVIDPGHGGRDSGASVGNVREKQLVLPYSLALEAALKARGYRTELTRRKDEDLAPGVSNWGTGKGIDLRKRSEKANALKADLFVSMHANAAASTAVNGAWVLYTKGSKAGQRAAALIFQQLAKVRGIADVDPDAEVYSDDSGWTGGRTLSVLRKTNMPAVLVELGFLTNPADLAQMQQTETIIQVANAVAVGVDMCLKEQH